MALLENLTFLDASSSSGFLLLGFLIGMVHALEADHLAAVSTLSNGGKNKLLLRGAVWGLGHTATLLVMSIGVIVFSLVLSEQRAAHNKRAPVACLNKQGAVTTCRTESQSGVVVDKKDKRPDRSWPRARLRICAVRRAE